MNRTQPHSQEAERGVLGSLIMDSANVMTLCCDNNITADAFYVPAHRHLFEAISKMIAEDKQVDMLTLGEELKDAGCLEAIGGHAYIESIFDDTPTSAHAEYYIGFVRQKSLLRRLIDAGTTAIDNCYDETDETAEKIIAKHSEAITEIVTTKDERTAAECMGENITVLNNAFNGIVSGIPLPWPRFSNHTGGLQSSCVTPLVGRDGKGKSGALSQCLDFWAGEMIPTLAFSLEDVKRRTLLRMGGCREWYSARCAEMGTVMMNGRFERMDKSDKLKVESKIKKYRSWIANKPFWIFDDPVTVEDICHKVKHYVRTKGVRVVTIDGFKDIQHSFGENTTGKESHIAKKLQALAKSTGAAILVVSHINKIDEGVPICKIHITGSGEQSKGARQVMIFQDAGIDGVDGEETFGLCMSKSNFGGSGVATLRRDQNVLYYSEL